MEPKVILKVLTGSRLHGLAKEDADYDWRGIHIHPLKDVLSPFKKTSNTIWLEGETKDDTSYELTEFCKYMTKGNPTIYEIMFSDVVEETTPLADELRDNWEKLIDTDLLVMASRGYAHNQYNKMHIFEPDNRTPKFAVAYCRVLWQCAEFLEHDVFPTYIFDDDLRKYLWSIKHDWSSALVPSLTERFVLLQQAVTEAYTKAKIRKPDVAWIEAFIERAYKNES